MAKSVVTNTGPARFIGYLPPHGRTLANGAVHTVDGDLRTRIAASNHSPKLKLASLDTDEHAGTIHVVDHPSLESSNS